VRAITPEIEAMAGAPRSLGVGSGGMVTKIAAAKIAVAAGCHMAIVNGVRPHPVSSFERDGRGTWFIPAASPRAARKQWIGGALQPAGAVIVDDGAAAALAAGKSLLPAGVVALEGAFERGDAVMVKTRDGRELARGLIAYSRDDAARIMGHKSREIEALLGYRGRQEMIHRDNLVIRE